MRDHLRPSSVHLVWRRDSSWVLLFLSHSHRGVVVCVRHARIASVVLHNQLLQGLTLVWHLAADHASLKLRVEPVSVQLAELITSARLDLRGDVLLLLHFIGYWLRLHVLETSSL